MYSTLRKPVRPTDMPTCPCPTPRPRLWPLTLLALALVLAWDASPLDQLVMSALGDGHGFFLRHQWLLERVLHDAVRELSLLFFLLLVLMVWRPMGIFRTISQCQRAEIVLGITLGLLVVNLVKRQSLTSCPWDLQEFGGTAQYVSHWAWRVQDGGPGRCFPGGHVSSALAYLASPLPWLASPEPARQRLGRQLLLGILTLGLVLGATQTLRGAHYPSHTWWTALLCWCTAWGNHQLFEVFAKRRRDSTPHPGCC